MQEKRNYVFAITSKWATKELLKSAADSGVEAAQKFLGYQNGKIPDYNVPLAKLLEENFRQNEKN